MTAQEVPLIYPAPTLTERKPPTTHMSTVEIIIIVLTSISILHALAWLLYLFCNRKHRVFVASSPVFLGTMLVGSLFFYASIFAWLPNYHFVTDVSCSLRVWLLALGWVLCCGYAIVQAFGFIWAFLANKFDRSLIAKSGRVLLLYSRQRLKRLVIRDSHVALFLAILLSVDGPLTSNFHFLKKKKAILLVSSGSFIVLEYFI